MNIGGTKITVGIKINIDDNREYLDIVSELQDKIADTIESLGHEFVIVTSKPIDEEELR